MGSDLHVFQDNLIDSLRTDALHLLLLPTEKCNFRCTYCYEDFANGRMSPEVVQGVKRLIERRLGALHLLQICWFGGEPLLALPVIEDISEYITSAVSIRPDLRYEGSMTTNGYLLDTPTVNRLLELGITQYQISLDGPEPFHDQTRVQANGRGSFQGIWKNLLTIRASAAPLSIMLRVHLTPDNWQSMPEFRSEEHTSELQ